MIDSRRARTYREVLGQYPTGVSVVTARADDGTLAGMTVGSFTSVSLDPPLVAFLPARTSTSWPAIQRAGRFCVNVLAWDQEHICQQMARSAVDKFADVKWRPSGAGSPVIEGAVAWVDCVIESVTEAGDHYIVVGAVRDLDIANEFLPLVFFRGGYGRFSPGPLVTNEFGPGGRVGLLNAARAEMLRIGGELGVECAITGFVDGDLILIASTWSPLSSRARVRVGDHVPVEPPYAVTFAAGDPSVGAAWLARGLDMSDDVARGELAGLLAEVRASGWGAGLTGRPSASFPRRLILLNARLRAGQAGEDPFNLSAPVHDSDGKVVFAFSIYGMHPSLSGRALRATVDRLKAAARAVEQAA